MTTRRTMLAAMAGAMMLSAAAYAQTTTDSGNAAPQPPKAAMAPSPETVQHMLDGRMAMIKTALQLTPDQEKLWAPVEQLLRDQAATRAKRTEDMHGKRHDMAAVDPVARLEMISQRASERAAATQKLADALKPLYATLNDQQKAVAAWILEPHRGWGHRHMMRG